MAAQEWENVIAVNLSGTFYCCQAVARRMRETGGGAIVNLSSVGGLIGLSHRPAYTASKHGVVGPDQEPRARPGGRRHPRQRGLPGRDPDAADGAVLDRPVVRGAARHGRARRAVGGGRRRRERRAVPRERHGRVRERDRADGRRRLARREELRARPGGRLELPRRRAGRPTDAPTACGPPAAVRRRASRATRAARRGSRSRRTPTCRRRRSRCGACRRRRAAATRRRTRPG